METKIKWYKSIVVTAIMTVFSVLGVYAETPDYYLSYIETSGLQYIDTGVDARAGTKSELSVKWLDTSTDTCLLGARGNDETPENLTRIYLAHAHADNIGYGYGFYGEVQYSSSWGTVESSKWEYDRLYNIISEFALNEDGRVTGTIKFDSVNVAYFGPTNVIDAGINLTLFGINKPTGVDSMSSVRFYGGKIWQKPLDQPSAEWTLKRDYKPCVKDGRAGLYDAVTDTIFYSDTAVDFKYDATENTPDTYIDYVDSDSVAYIDTLVRGRSGTKCEADFEWLKGDADLAFLNARSSFSANDRVFLLHNYDNKFCWGYGSFKNTGKSIEINKRYFVESELAKGKQKIVVDGVELVSGSDLAVYDTGFTFYLFANNVGSTAYNQNSVRLYGLKIWQTASKDDTDGYELVRDFRPCLKHGIAALYDAVSQTIFYPKTGTLKGSKKEEKPDYYVTYIEADGYSFLDTEVRARSGTRASGEVMWTRNYGGFDNNNKYFPTGFKTENSFLAACASDGSKRFYLMHNPHGTLWSGYGDQRAYLSTNATVFVDQVVTNEVEGVKVVTTNKVETIEAKQFYVNVGTRYNIEAEYNVGFQKVTLDGAVGIESNCTDYVDAGCNLFAFACSCGGKSQYNSRARCYWLKIWQDDVLVRDFKPAVKDGVAGLYDAVSKRMFYTSNYIESHNVGTPIFTSDMKPKDYVEYVETDGNIYFDTGVIGRVGTVAEFDMAWLYINNLPIADGDSCVDVDFLGVRQSVSTDSRFFMWHTAWGCMGYANKYFCYPSVLSPEVSTSGGKDANNYFIEKGRKYHVRSSFLKDRLTIVVDGKTIVDRNETFNLDTGLPMYLFACNLAGTPAYYSKVRFYGLKIWQDGVLLRDYCPVKLDSTLPALWDKKNDVVYAPTQSFAAVGPVTEPISRNGGTVLILR